MLTSLFALEQAARRGQVLPAIEVLLDELESLGMLGAGDRVARFREHISRIARTRGSIWAQRPEVTLIDLYARMLELTGYDAVQQRWVAELDARGPWLRALRPWCSDASVVAELRSSPALEQLIGLRFEDEDQVVFAREGDELHAWSWTRAHVERRTDLEPITPPDHDDPRFDPDDASERPCYRASPNAEARPLPWPEFGHAHAKLSSDGRTIFLYGWYDDYLGLLQRIDARTLSVTHKHEFSHTVWEVFERPGSDELLVTTSDGLMIVGRDGPIWTRPRAGGRLAWSPSGRYVCTVNRGVAQIVDTRADARSTNDGAGLPLSFSPDGERIVDGDALLDGRTGTKLAPLDVRRGQYLEGGPAWPWHHVGTELIVCIHGGLALWDARTGAPVKPGEHLHVSHWERVAYSRCGRWLARGRQNWVTIKALPSTATVAELEFDLTIERLALSSTGELVAAYGAGEFELRDRAGTLIGTGRTSEPRTPERFVDHQGSFEFLDGDRRLRLHEPERSGWSSTNGEWSEQSMTCVWDLETDPAPLSDIDSNASEALPPGWTIEPGPVSIFTHTLG
ncbi:MAG TPA: hypothetical protein VM869_15770, partial [Enhygromyxa sp.]|nr:hypothetical protein [Enhygromyxa sp.]